MNENSSSTSIICPTRTECWQTESFSWPCELSQTDRKLQLALRVIIDGGCTDLKVDGRKHGWMDGWMDGTNSKEAHKLGYCYVGCRTTAVYYSDTVEYCSRVTSPYTALRKMQAVGILETGALASPSKEQPPGNLSDFERRNRSTVLRKDIMGT
jgi:hypothetical protein